MTIKELRKRTGLSQIKFGEKYGIPRRTIEDWERGIRQPTTYFINLFEKVLRYEELYGEIPDVQDL